MSATDSPTITNYTTKRDLTAGSDFSLAGCACSVRVRGPEVALVDKATATAYVARLFRARGGAAKPEVNMWGYIGRHTWQVAVLAGLVFAVVGGIAYATIPGSDGAIHGCYQKDIGNLRVIDPSTGETCGPSELPITWNQQGQPGVQGPQGPKGDTGPQGPSGADGASVTSAALNPGDDPACPTGGSKFSASGGSTTYACNGATGAQGPAGPQGASGPQGPAGPAGQGTFAATVRAATAQPSNLGTPNLGQLQLFDVSLGGFCVLTLANGTQDSLFAEEIGFGQAQPASVQLPPGANPEIVQTNDGGSGNETAGTLIIHDDTTDQIVSVAVDVYGFQGVCHGSEVGTTS